MRYQIILEKQMQIGKRHPKRLLCVSYLEENLEVVDALNGQFEVFAQSFVVADPVTVFLNDQNEHLTIKNLDP
jgi:hypothetical protein